MGVSFLLLPLCAAQEFADPARSRLPPSPSEWLAKQQRTGLTAVTSSSSGGPIFTPTSYGGDPTGAADSTAAVQAALDAAFAWTAPDPILDALNGTKLFHGGAAVDLGGGTYRVAKPLRLGSGLSLRLCCGSEEDEPEAREEVPRERPGQEGGHPLPLLQRLHRPLCAGEDDWCHPVPLADQELPVPAAPAQER